MSHDFVRQYLMLLFPLSQTNTPKRATHAITKILLDASGQTGVYYDAGGHPMQGLALVRDPNFQVRFVVETRSLLAKIPTFAAAR